MKKPAVSPRIVYSPFRHSDIDFTLEYLSDAERTRYLPNEKPYPKALALEWVLNRILHWEKHGFGTFMLREKSADKRIGFCGLEYVRKSDFIDIRYGLIQDAWGKGLAVEAAQACIEFGFSHLNLPKIYGAAVPENRPSIAVLKKLGMTPDPDFDIYGDVVAPYSISASDFLKSQQP